MPARTPEELPQLFAQAFGAHDLEAALALYEPEAILIPQPGQVVTGTGAIREALSGFFALKPKFESEFKKAFQVGELALRDRQSLRHRARLRLTPRGVVSPGPRMLASENSSFPALCE